MLRGTMKPLIPEDRARDIVVFRISQARDSQTPSLPTLEEFGRQLVELGYLDAVVSRETLRRLLSGRMYPKLEDPETGKPFEWAVVPSAARGKRSRESEIAELRQHVNNLLRRVEELEASRSL